jgi:VCBS repeat-containing protein
MQYVMANKWSLTEHFAIHDGAGNEVFDVRGNLSLTQHLSLRDASGRQLAEIKKHLMTTAHEILIDGHRAAEVRHTGFFGDKFEIDSSFGRLTARGDFAGWNYSIEDHRQQIAQVHREFALREKFAVDILDGANDVFILCVVLAIDAIHDERRADQEDHRGGMMGGMLGGGMGGGIGGGIIGDMLGGNFP